MQAELNSGAGYSFWNANRTMADYLPVLKRFQYQMAPRTSIVATGDIKEGSDVPDALKHTADGVFLYLSMSHTQTNTTAGTF